MIKFRLEQILNSPYPNEAKTQPRRTSVVQGSQDIMSLLWKPSPSSPSLSILTQGHQASNQEASIIKQC